ncbi:15-hydroxyprostaglandin dehydrogenase [NAD(+)]-like [Trichoplusia ni]|uniref:15-hydroxyprostaglandin dehydrogenase [NAD(+)]-like n=1 Tax=Trichoplusia ni TaxID=7111 RepID=A0A7E5WP19_TRINI|nr:15-hydroxyprostaglandin dehydrogenase [NAD(+)]-like [Trichoplusia ni]
MAAKLVKRYLCVEDKVFLVTGGAAGVGAGIVRALLAENARHVAFLDVADREGSALELELLNKFGALRAKFIKCDIADDAQLAAAYKQVVDKYRRLDGVINNAAVLTVDEKTYKRMVDINFSATVSSTMKALDIMDANKGGNGGTIINISSLLALNLGSHLPVYAATKTAVLQFSIAMGTQSKVAQNKVRVITVCLGPTDTAILNRNNLENFDKDSTGTVASRVPVRQRVESAVAGILEAISEGKSGSTWIVKNDQPAYDYTDKLLEAFEILSES